MDLGPSGNTAETDELSHSSSDERTRSGSPLNNAETGSKKSTGRDHEIAPSDHENSNFRDGKRSSTAREESPESESHALGPNKAPRLNSSKPLDQSTEATMRKARVSVRARSEAPMVYISQSATQQFNFLQVIVCEV